ncbi:MAG TPA: T9SS type A sorting domain-containing protein [bacterium]
MNKLIMFILFWGAITLVSVDPLSAQFMILRHVFGNGNTAVTGSEFQIVGTLGQAAIGVSSSQSLIHQSGFWGGLDLVTSVEPIPNIVPNSFRLDQNYPNPFNPSTTIQFAVPTTSHVSMKLFDLRGREVGTLLDNRMPAGEYKLQFEATGLASGVYFYRMQSDGFVQSRKLTLLR